MMPQPAARSNRQTCDAPRSCTTPYRGCLIPLVWHVVSKGSKIACGQPLREVIMLFLSRRSFTLGALASAVHHRTWAQNDEIRVICSGGFTAAYNILAPRFEQVTGKKVVSAYGASMGNASDAIPQRLARGE